jgi:putative membrane protein
VRKIEKWQLNKNYKRRNIMKTITQSLGYLTLASAVLVGCMTSTNPATAEHDTEKTSMMNKEMAMKKDTMKKEQKLNDLQIAHTAYTAGAIDIRYAHLALALSDNPEVRQFAELMIRDHTAVNNKALALVQKLQITPQDNPTSQQLTEQATKIRTELSQLRGDAFAKRYAANELGYHQTVNNVVENTFIPQAQNTELKALLTAALQTFKVHEGHAETMNKKVM